MIERSEGGCLQRRARSYLTGRFLFLVQTRVATAVVLNSIPLATSPNGALLVTWLVVRISFLHLRWLL